MSEEIKVKRIVREHLKSLYPELNSDNLEAKVGPGEHIAVTGIKDPTPELLRELICKGDERVRVFRLDENEAFVYGRFFAYNIARFGFCRYALGKIGGSWTILTYSKPLMF